MPRRIASKKGTNQTSPMSVNVMLYKCKQFSDQLNSVSAINMGDLADDERFLSD